jgi:hypothetical protein
MVFKFASAELAAVDIGCFFGVSLVPDECMYQFLGSQVPSLNLILIPIGASQNHPVPTIHPLPRQTRPMNQSPRPPRPQIPQPNSRVPPPRQQFTIIDEFEGVDVVRVAFVVVGDGAAGEQAG